MTGLGLGALCVAGTLLAPALQAQENGRVANAIARPSVAMRGGLGTFTPAAADPKLAAILARSGLPESGFRFTPSESSRNGERRAVTVAVRARSTRAARIDRNEMAAAATPSVSLAPIAYNLGVSVGWKRFAIAGDVSRIEMVTQPGSRERANLGVSYTGSRITGRVQAAAERPLASTPILIGDKPNYSVDLGGSYSVTRNLAVTAGVRYKSEADRLPKITDDRRDSQAVYVGTAFRF
ncbi:hypothetical protein [Sphingomonas sp. M1-B02]|uniref:hypothetical protein n=1 Tax=Sphingomonas sp. M1-B02 TaxID=3114300 RepID=UPI002240307A|nr:hypothetical protein [Sphingomonas sp. S6-11]UZK65215.1 hypothetical protein OKW87_11905 [Sphingomonas sp. S6-11]